MNNKDRTILVSTYVIKWKAPINTQLPSTSIGLFDTITQNCKD